MTYEENVGNNIKENFKKANKNKKFLENIYNYNYNIPVKPQHSIFLWNNHNNIIFMEGKCNHIFLYNCSHITLHHVDCLTGITIINCKDCHILLKSIPFFNLEISRSKNIILRAFLFAFPILFKNCSYTLVKDYDYKNIGFMKIIDDNIFSDWNYEYFNF